MTSTTVTPAPDLALTLDEAGDGRPVLVLHGGGGPFTVAGVAAHLAATMHTLVPTHPGWNGTPRPERLATVADLARVYLDLLAERDLSDVLVVGSSLGGWIAAEMALADTAHRITGLVLLNAVGIEVPGEPIRDFAALDPRSAAEYSWHDADRFFRDPALLTPEQVAAQRANMATMAVLAGPDMSLPDLAGRLADIRVPAIVIWGASDRIVTPAYGAAFAAAIPDARFEIVSEAGHLPHIEQPEATFALLDAFPAPDGASAAGRRP